MQERPKDHSTHAPPGAEGRQHTGMGDAVMGHEGMMLDTSLVFAVTGPQLLAITFLTLLALAAAVLWSASHANLTLSAKEVGGLVMPPGMIMTRETSAEAMRDMAAVSLHDVRYTAPRAARGDQPLSARIEGMVKVFDLEASIVRWYILPGVRVAAYAYNGLVPGPRLQVTEGDRVRINVTNRLPESTTVHWHGLVLPNSMDGPAEITQEPIGPGETYTYEFTARQHGTFFYHSHDHVDRQQALGLYGALIIDPAQPPAAPEYDKELVVQLQRRV